jgi:hypothetical protein
MKSVKSGDIIIAAAVFLVSAALLAIFFLTGPEPGKEYAEVSIDGEKIARLSLNRNAEFDTAVGVRIAVLNGEVFVSESDCPDRLCIRQGKISRPGRMIVCLPNRVVVKIISDEDNRGLDAVA